MRLCFFCMASTNELTSIRNGWLASKLASMCTLILMPKKDYPKGNTPVKHWHPDTDHAKPNNHRRPEDGPALEEHTG